MNKVFMLLAAFITLSIFEVKASDSCKILFNKQVIFKGEVDQENAVAFLKAKKFKPADCLTIKYYNEVKNEGWTRTFYLTSVSGQSVKTVEAAKQNAPVTVTASVLNKLKEHKQPFTIYTISLPEDKALAARIRVRRIFICKVEWN